MIWAILICSATWAYATESSLSVLSPRLSTASAVNLTSPVHFQATTESNSLVTGYVVYVDNQNVYQNFSPGLDAWVLVPTGVHSLYIKAWDSSGSVLSTPAYTINVAKFAPPVPPATATRIINIDNPGAFPWEVSALGGGQCSSGTIGNFISTSDPNLENAPDFDGQGQHFQVTSKCQYDDTLFVWKDTTNPSPYAGGTNFLWDFWFYIPTTTIPASVQALEFDLFQSVQLSDGVHEFMFGSQCDFVTDQWQLWLPSNGTLTWVNAGLSPCRFTPGSWHHATYFYQRVTTSGYQQIPASFSSSTDTNTNLRFGTLTIDGVTLYLGQTANSTIPQPAWSPALGLQHQLDSAATGVTIDEYVDNESLIVW